MSIPKPNLKNLSSLASAAVKADPASLPLDRIYSVAQIRTEFDEDYLAELAESMKFKGVLQAISVHEEADGYRIIIGECRYRSAKIAGLNDIPVKIYRNLSDYEIAVMQRLENSQRSNLSVWDECQAVKRDVVEYGIDKAMEMWGKSKSWVIKRSQQYATAVQELIKSRKISDLEIAGSISKAIENQVSGVEAYLTAGVFTRESSRQLNSPKPVAAPPQSQPKVAASEPGASAGLSKTPLSPQVKSTAPLIKAQPKTEPATATAKPSIKAEQILVDIKDVSETTRLALQRLFLETQDAGTLDEAIKLALKPVLDFIESQHKSIDNYL